MVRTEDQIRAHIVMVTLSRYDSLKFPSAILLSPGIDCPLSS